MHALSSQHNRGAVLVELAIVIFALFTFLAGFFQLGRIISEIISASNSAYILAMVSAEDTPTMSGTAYSEGYGLQSRKVRIAPIINKNLTAVNATADFNMNSFDAVNQPLGRSVRVRFQGEMAFDLGFGTFDLGKVLRLGETTVGPFLMPNTATGVVNSFQNPPKFYDCNGGTIDAGNQCRTGCSRSNRNGCIPGP